MTFSIDIKNLGYKPPCPRIGCNEIGIYKLKIILVNRWAYFCAKHKKELEECGLINQVNMPNGDI